MINIKYHLLSIITAASIPCLSLAAESDSDPHPHNGASAHYIHEGHADIVLNYDAAHGLEFLVLAEHHDGHEAGEGDTGHSEEEHDHEGLEGALHLEDAIFVLGGYSIIEVPNNPALSFLGEVGAPIYLSGQQESQGVPFIGWNTEFLNPDLGAETVTIELHGISGPGHVYLYQVDSLGAVTLLWNSADTEEDTLQIALGTHSHYNLAVTTEGIYTLELHAEYQITGGETATAHAHLNIHAGGVAGYYGHFEWPTDEWLWAETGGWLYVEAWPWVWQLTHGWLYAYGHGGPNHFYYKSLSEDWLWTSPDVFPFYWSFENSQWANWE